MAVNYKELRWDHCVAQTQATGLWCRNPFPGGKCLPGDEGMQAEDDKLFCYWGLRHV